MDGIKNRRKQYLVNKRLQGQFSLLLILQAVIPIVLLGSSLYIVNRIYLFAIQRIIGYEALSDIDIQNVLNFSIQAILALVVITAVLLAYIGIRFSHHIAGPVYKLEETMDRLAEGEKVEPLHFRKSDAIMGLAEKFNIIIKKLNQVRQ